MVQLEVIFAGVFAAIGDRQHSSNLVERARHVPDSVSSRVKYMDLLYVHIGHAPR